jgi:hypothetical protein
MSGFRGSAGHTKATFGVDEARVLRSLIGELIELLRDGQPLHTPGRDDDDMFAALVGQLGSPEPPEDDVLARLFPNAYADDEDAAGEVRRFTEPGLRNAKVANAELVLESLGDPEYADRVTVTLEPDGAQAWLRTLTDLRLALGTRLGVEQDDEDRWSHLPLEDPSRHVYGVYTWLGYLQETLVNTL